MAAWYDTSAINYLTQCSICKGDFNEPKGLPCFHTFCLGCLKQYGSDQQPGDKMSCPLCRKDFEIPAGGFEKLPDNFFVNQILSTIQLFKTGSSNSGVKCDGCDRTDAIKYCVDCAESICENCLVPHRRMRLTQFHKVVSLQEKEGSQVYMRARPIYCSTHATEQLKLYCNDCELTICFTCSATAHRSHFCEDLQTKSRLFCDKLKDVYPKLRHCKSTIDLEVNALDATRKKLLQQVSACQHSIVEHGKELKRLIDAQCKQLLNQLASFKDDKFKEMKAKNEEVEMQLMVVESLRSYVEELTDKGSACIIAQSTKDLLARTDELVTSSQRDLHKRSLNKDLITFEPAVIPDIISSEIEHRLIGSIFVNEASECSKELVIIGLYDGATAVQRVCHVSLECVDQVKTIDSTPSWVNHEAAACVMGNTLYAVGIGRSSNELWKWDAASAWRRLEDMASPRSKHCVAVVDSTLFAFGGCSTNNGPTLSSVVAYNTLTSKWFAAGYLFLAIRYAACIAYHNSIYVFGGISAGNKEMGHVQVYDAVESTCAMMQQALPRARHTRAVLWKSSALLFGPHTCVIYNLEAQTWQEREHLKADVSHCGLTLHNETLYIAGGCSTKKNKDGRVICLLTEEVKSISLNDVIEGKPAVWKHHAKLPQPAMIFGCGLIPVVHEASSSQAIKA